MDDIQDQLIVGFEFISTMFIKNVWLGVMSTIIFILILIGLRILDSKYSWVKKLKKGTQGIKDVAKESKNNKDNVAKGDDWDPPP